MAVVQANQLLEDRGRIQSGQFGRFVGIYDRHGVPEVSKFINEHLFRHLISFASESGGMSVDVIRMAYNATEEGFESIVKQDWATRPQIAAVGSCSLAGVIYNGHVSLQILVTPEQFLGLYKPTGTIMHIQLTTEHNASNEAARQELKSLHPDDPNIVLLKRGGCGL